MNELEDLYREIIVDHSRRPRNFGSLEGATARAEGHNPLCGDKISLELKLENDVVTGIGFYCSGCAISTASASLMTETLKGKSREEAEALFERFHRLLTKDAPASPELGKLAAFAGVREFPVRVKCATLAWHTLRAALEQAVKSASAEIPRVSTE